MDTIRLVDLRSKEKDESLETIFDGIRKIYESSQFVLGDAVREFEMSYARLAGCQFGVGLNSGTDGLLLALRALGVGPGDEVITASNSFVGTAGAIHLTGAKTVFADIGYDYNIDPTKIEAAITKRTKAILPVHLTGYPCKMDPIMELARAHNLHVIEDAAQAIGATYKGKLVGSFGAVGSFSIHPLKNLHLWGDGGMATTNDETLAEQLRMQRNHGMKNRDEVEFFSYNSRLDSIQAVVGLESLKRLEGVMKARTQNAKIYDERLKDLEPKLIRPPIDRDNCVHAFHLYVVRVKNREKVMNALLENGVETKVHYPIPIHRQKAARYLGYREGDLPVTDQLAGEILSLPTRENLTEAQVHHVCDTIKAVL